MHSDSVEEWLFCISAAKGVFFSFSAFWGNPNSRTYTLNAFGFSGGMTFLHFWCKGCPFLHFLHFGATQTQGHIHWMHSDSVEEWLFCISAAKGVLFCIFCIFWQPKSKEVTPNPTSANMQPSVTMPQTNRCPNPRAPLFIHIYIICMYRVVHCLDPSRDRHPQISYQNR
jgi:hypothetical protein